MASLAQLVVRPANTMRVVMGTQPPLVVIWPSKGAVQRNWGDKLNPWLVSRLSGRNVLNAATVFKQAVPIVHAVVGSHVGRITRPNVNIFGTGFMRHADRLRIEVRKICAVRGPFTADKLRDHVDMASLPIGDPALLVPLLHPAVRKKTHRLGIIPHFREQNLPIFNGIGSDPSVKLIDVMGSIEGFCDEVSSCETIVSSSLHGAVLAHAYGVPASIVALSGLPVGDGFKHLDYLSSVGLTDTVPQKCTTRAELLHAADAAQMPRALPGIERLLLACPFMDEDVRSDMIARIPSTYAWASWASH